jgi:hypothetical protein
MPSVDMLNVIMLSVVMLSVIMLSVIMLSVIMLSAIMLSVIMPSVIMLSVVMLSVIMLNVVMLNVVAPISDIFLVSWNLKIIFFCAEKDLTRLIMENSKINVNFKLGGQQQQQESLVEQWTRVTRSLKKMCLIFGKVAQNHCLIMIAQIESSKSHCFFNVKISTKKTFSLNCLFRFKKN